jgi:Phage tail tube protein, GTA-gp10
VQTWVDLKFADGEYTFRLGLAQIAEIEKRAGDGIGAVYARVLAGRYGLAADEILPTDGSYRFNELVEVVRQALIGGGGGVVDGQGVRVNAIRANELIERYILAPSFDRMPLRELWALAAAILSALAEGYEPPKKAEPAEKPATPRKRSTSRGRSQTAP